MSTQQVDTNSSLNSNLHPEKYQNIQSPSSTIKLDLSNEKQIILNQTIDEQIQDEEILKKKIQNKQRYRRLKQKLSNICINYQQQQYFIKNNKDILSTQNKSRILILAIQFQKITLNQTKDIPSIQFKLKQILKILDLKRQYDLIILKQSKFIPAFATFLKKVPTLHKNQFCQSIKSVQLGLKVLRIFSTLSVNREYMICTNQLLTLNSCLNSFISKQQKKLSIQCIDILHEILCSKIKSDSQTIILLTLQIIFFGQLTSKLKSAIQNCINDDGLIDQEFVIKSLKYLYIIYHKCYQKYLQRPIYQQPDILQPMQSHLDSLLLSLQHLLPNLLLDKQQAEPRDQQPPICVLNISLLILKLINLSAHVNYRLTQKTLQISQTSLFWQSIKFLFKYSQQNSQLSSGNHQIKSIYSQIIQLLGRMCCQSQQNRKTLANTCLLQMLYNHPLVYIMDPKLKSILIPTLCAVMDHSQSNMKKYLNQNSAQNIINYVTNQKKLYEQLQQTLHPIDQPPPTESQEESQTKQQVTSTKMLTRKQSVNSLNSYTTQYTQNSSLPISQQDKYTTGLYFLLPYPQWQPFIQQLRILDQ